ncbi:phage shock envelope stress response protein PspM [Actinopolyspora saharensis]|uniref:phage shock envelope stress response protein PspM n=1 Tax=Actinopolyspora saharensis TaxID=995062 RepID=UPI003F6755BF
MGRRDSGIGDWGDYALEQLRGPVLTNIKQRVASWRDPRARLLRRRKRAKRLAVGSGTTTGVFGGGAYLSYAPETLGLPAEPAGETLFDLASLGLGGIALAAGVGTVGALRHYRRLKRTPLPAAPPEPPRLPPRSSAAHEPMRQLAEAERSLHDSLNRLDTGIGQGDDPVSGARSTAAEVAVALRSVADRLEAVEGTLEHAPGEQRRELEEEIRRMRAELDEGVERYGSLVAAAGRAIAAGGSSDQRDHRMQDATDRLAGLAEGLRELSGERSRPDRERGSSE